MINTLEDIRYLYNREYLKKYSKPSRSYNLTSVDEQNLYIENEAKEELEFLRKYFTKNTIVNYLLAPKLAGKGTYINTLIKFMPKDRWVVISVGDLFRYAEEEIKIYGDRCELYTYAEKNHRGMQNPEQIIDSIKNRSLSGVSSSETAMLLIRREALKHKGKSIFLDGFPRNAEQVELSLLVRELIDMRNDPDVFTLINIPLGVIEERLKSRRTCPVCRSSRNIKLLPAEVYFDDNKKDFEMYCDGPDCRGKNILMLPKEGDEKGIELIKDRLIDDYNLMNKVRTLYGIDIIELFNSIPEEDKDLFSTDFELTKSYNYTVSNNTDIKYIEEDFSVTDNGVKYYSYLAYPVVVQYIKELYKFIKNKV